jgi:cytochrome c oxidase subunit 1
MLYVLAFFAIFGVGGLTGLFLGALATDVPLHDTYFVVAHFHFVMVGAVMIAFLAGVHYWWPKMTGRMYDERLGAASAALVFLGFNLTFIPQFVVGVGGMPRRYATYAAEFQAQNRLSTVGAFVLTLGLVIALYGLLASLGRAGKRAPANPWGAATLEWQAASPPTHHNFEVPPGGVSPYDYTTLKELPGDEGWVVAGQEVAS